MKINLNDLYIYEWGFLHYFEQKNFISFNVINHFIRSQELTLQLAKEDFKQRLREDKDLKNLEEQYIGGYYEHVYADEEETIEESRRLFRYVICQLLFTTFEGKLKTLCELVRDEFGLKPIKKKAFTSDYWNYLLYVYEIQAMHILPKYTSIDAKRFLRNSVTHNDGRLTDEEIIQVNKLDHLSVVHISGENMLMISSTDFLFSVLQEMKTFIEDLLVLIDKRYIILKREK